ncbi:hypothetical protein FLA_1055 [Filimonas lacunae]|nr:hypothetical protein FLA_0882 [Filimonas lacunae]BAV05050.1 hypothetical protein FLA_1055 [Filimonas lacunae]
MLFTPFCNFTSQLTLHYVSFTGNCAGARTVEGINKKERQQQLLVNKQKHIL